MLFSLTAEQIRNRRLSDKDFSDAAGFEVNSHEVRAFPHFDVLRAGRRLRFPDQFNERLDTIRDAMRDTGFARSFQSSSFRIPMDAIGPAVLSRQEKIDFAPGSNTAHFELIRANGFVNAHDAASPIWQRLDGSARHYVFPGATQQDLPAHTFTRTYAAYVLTDREGSAAEWVSGRSAIPAALLASVPTSGFHALASDVHERRHLQEIAIQIGDKKDRADEDMMGVRDNAAANEMQESVHFNLELDAHMTERHTLREAKIGDDVQSAALNACYTSMVLSREQRYWFAPVLEDVEAGKTSDDFFVLSRKVGEVCMRIGQQLAKGGQSEHSSLQLQSAWGALHGHASVSSPLTAAARRFKSDFQDVVAEHRENPAPIFTALRKLADSRAFAPETEKLAARIVRAAEAFNPDLPYFDRPGAQRRLTDVLKV